AALGGQLEAAVAVAVAEEESERTPNRAAPDAGGAERFDHGGRVVRVDGPRRPTPAAAAALQGEQPAGRASRERLPGRPEGDHAPGGSVDGAADRAVRAFERAKPREQPVGTLAERLLGESDEGEVGRAAEFGLVGGEVLRGRRLRARSRA